MHEKMLEVVTGSILERAILRVLSEDMMEHKVHAPTLELLLQKAGRSLRLDPKEAQVGLDGFLVPQPDLLEMYEKRARTRATGLDQINRQGHFVTRDAKGRTWAVVAIQYADLSGGVCLVCGEEVYSGAWDRLLHPNLADDLRRFLNPGDYHAE